MAVQNMENCMLVLSLVMKQLGLDFFPDFACDFLSRVGFLRKTPVCNVHIYEETTRGRCF